MIENINSFFIERLFVCAYGSEDNSQKGCAVMMMSYTKNISIYSLWMTSIY